MVEYFSLAICMTGLKELQKNIWLYVILRNDGSLVSNNMINDKIKVIENPKA